MRGPGLTGWFQAIGTRRGVAAALVTVLTFAVIGVVLVAATPIGCGPARAVGFKTIATCGRSVAAHSPAPSPFLSPSPLPTETFAASPEPSPSPSATPSGGEPVNPADPGATAAYPPFDPGVSGPNGTVVAGVQLNCRLPIFVGPPGSGGFIVFPGDQFIADPSSAVSYPSASPGQPSPVPPVVYGPGPQSGFSYDAAFSKWVPVPFSQQSPDGKRYGFVSPSSIYVEDMTTGTLSELGQGQQWSILSVEAAGVYATQPGKSGLWLVPYSGAPRQITAGGFWAAATDRFAYGSPTSAVPQGATNSIIRVDLSTGQVSTWFTRVAATSNVIGLDEQGGAIISANGNGGFEIWFADSPTSAIPVLGNGNGFYINGAPVADGNGVWFAANFQTGYNSSQTGFLLYVPGQGRLFWMSNLAAQLAGGCFRP
jgi:hypothetical protein